MARLHLALLFLFVAFSAVIVSAVDKPSTTTAEAPAATTPTNGDVNAGGSPGDDNSIGTTDDDPAGTSDDDPAGTPDDDDVAVAGPIGSDASYANYPPSQQTSGSGATAMIGFASVATLTVGSVFFF